MEIQETRALMHDSAVASLMGIASGHLVVLSMIVNKYFTLCEGGSGPTMSTWRWPNRRVGSENAPMPDSVLRIVFEVWQWVQERAHCLMSRAIPGHMYFCFINFRAARREGCERPWTRSKALRRRGSGTHGRGVPLLVSQIISQLSEVLTLAVVDFELLVVRGGSIF